MRKKWFTALCCVMAAGLIGAIGAFITPKTDVKAEETTSGAAAVSYTYYSNATVRDLMGGKGLTWVTKSADSLIKRQNNDILTSDGYGHTIKADTAYNENAGITIGVNGTTWYQTYGYPELNFCGCPGGAEMGFEGIPEEKIEVAKTPIFSVELGYQPKSYNGINDNYAAYHVDKKPFSAYLYAYGTDENGAAKQVSKEIKFGMGYFTTAIFDLSGSGLKYVERFAVSSAWTDLFNFINDKGGKTAGYQYPDFYFANIKFGTAETAATETKFTADDNGVYFYNGGCLSGDLNSLDDVSYTKIYRAQIGYDGIAQGGYAYSTQRIFAGQYATLVFRNPVKASDYKYLDTSIIAWPQGAEDPFLAEMSKEFTFKALRYDAATVDGENCVTVNANYKKIKNFRIPLADYADDNGYVTKIVFYYAGTEAERTAEEAKKYSINMAFRDFTLTNAEQTVGAVKTMNLLLNGKIETRFGVELKDETQKNNAYLSVKVGNEEERRLTFADAEKSENGKYYFNIGIAAAQMTENIAVRVITADADSDIQNFTVRKYADYLLKKESSSAELKKLITAMLDYGAYAQVYFGVNTDKLANAGLHDDGKNPLDGVTISQSIKTEGSIDGLTDINADMFLQADNTLRLYFKTQNADAYNITVKYNDGKDRTFTLVYAEDKANGRYYVDIPHIPAPMLGTEYEITFKSADATLKKTLSGYSYAATLIADNSTEARKNVAKALYLYGEAAANYFKSI